MTAETTTLALQQQSPVTVTILLIALLVQTLLIFRIYTRATPKDYQDLKDAVSSATKDLPKRITDSFYFTSKEALEEAIKQRREEQLRLDSIAGPEPYPTHPASGSNAALGTTGTPRPITPKQRRIEAAQDRERMRSILRGLSPKGFYVFEDIVTHNEGAIDYLSVGPVGISIFMLRADHGELQVMPDTNEFLIYGRELDENVREALNAQARELERMLGLEPTRINQLVVFTRSGTYIVPGNQWPPNTCSIWNLHAFYENLPGHPAFDPETYNPANTAEIADNIEEVFQRPYLVQPTDFDYTFGIAEEDSR